MQVIENGDIDTTDTHTHSWRLLQLTKIVGPYTVHVCPFMYVIKQLFIRVGNANRINELHFSF